MGRAFAKAAGMPATDDSMLLTLSNLIEGGGLFVVGDPVYGMAAAIAYPQYFNTSRVAAQELFWWVDENARGSGAGRELMRALESWARDKGADTMMMVALDDLNGDAVAKMYANSGYKPLERNFVKAL